MIDLRSIRAIALDIADFGSSYDRQKEITDFIWCLLERNYKIFLVSTENQNDLSEEDFEHPRMNTLREVMPPSQASVKAHPDLVGPDTLWITDDDTLQRWVDDGSSHLVHLGEEERPHSMRLNRLSELSALLNPSAFLMEDLSAMVVDLRRSYPAKPLVIGISGPPRSDYQNFAVNLQRYLQDAGFDLVELMDLTSMLRPIDQVLTGENESTHPWITRDNGLWFEESILKPLKDGSEIYIEQAPSEITRDFHPHFPFFLSKESVLLLFSEMLLIQDIREVLDMSVLLELSPEETTRRLYEIPTEDPFDPKFTEQYMVREGRVYSEYLKQNHVDKMASVRIDANQEGALKFIPPEQPSIN